MLNVKQASIFSLHQKRKRNCQNEMCEMGLFNFSPDFRDSNFQYGFKSTILKYRNKILNLAKRQTNIYSSSV